MSSVLNEQEALNFGFISETKDIGTGTRTEDAYAEAAESVDTSPAVIFLDGTEEEEKGKADFFPKVIFHESTGEAMESPSTTNVIIDMLKQVEQEKQGLQAKVATLEAQLENATKRNGKLVDNDKLVALLEMERQNRFKEETKVKSYAKILGELQEELRVEKEQSRMASSAMSRMETEVARLKGEMAANEDIIKESFQRQRETYLNEYADLDSTYQSLLRQTEGAGSGNAKAEEFERKVKAFEHDKNNFDIYKKKRLNEFHGERRSIQLLKQKMEDALAQQRSAPNKPRAFQPLGYVPTRMARRTDGEYDQPYKPDPLASNPNHEEFMRAYKRHKSMGSNDVHTSSITDSTEALHSSTLSRSKGYFGNRESSLGSDRSALFRNQSGAGAYEYLNTSGMK